MTLTKKIFIILFIFLLAPDAWSKTLSGEIIIDSDMVVLAGETLTIEKGSKVYFMGGTINVYGTLIAKGDKGSNGILFAEKDEARKSGGIIIMNSKDKTSEISNCSIDGFKTAVTIANSKVEIKNCIFSNNAISIDSKQNDESITSHNIFDKCGKVGIFCKTDSKAQVQDNSISGAKKFGIYIYRAKDVKVIRNTVESCGTGIIVAYVGSNPIIADNLFARNNVGMLIEKGANPIVSKNKIQENNTGIKLSKRADPKITENNINDNKIGLFITYSSYPVIKGNNIFSNKEYAIYLEMQSAQWEASLGESMERGGEKKLPAKSVGAFSMGGKTEFIAPSKNASDKVDARGNYWGGEVAVEMGKKGSNADINVIYDYYDENEFEYEGKKYKLDSVDYSDHAKAKINIR